MLQSFKKSLSYLNQVSSLPKVKSKSSLVKSLNFHFQPKLKYTSIKLIGSKTHQNLKEAFAGESMVYLFQ